MTTSISKTRIYSLADAVSSSTVTPIIKAIYEFNEEDERDEQSVIGFVRKPIKILVNTPGGFCSDGFALMDAMEQSKTPIHTFCLGKAYSMGVPIMLAGHEKFAYKHSEFMIHEISAGSIGRLTEIEESIPHMNHTNKQLMKYIADKSKIKSDRLKAVCKEKNDWYIYSNELVKFGLVDKIL